jgi:radical SAM-linked protein
LSLGIESYCESFDIRIEGEYNPEEIKNSLNAVLPQGLEITGVSDSFMKCNDIAFAEYEAVFEFDEEGTGEAFFNEIQPLLESDELITTKKAKQRGRKIDVEVNLKEYIKSFEFKSENSNLKLYITLAAGNSKNLNPTVLFERLMRDSAVVPDLTRITKKRLLTVDGKEFK